MGTLDLEKKSIESWSFWDIFKSIEESFITFQSSLKLQNLVWTIDENDSLRPHPWKFEEYGKSPYEWYKQYAYTTKGWETPQQIREKAVSLGLIKKLWE